MNDMYICISSKYINVQLCEHKHLHKVLIILLNGFHNFIDNQMLVLIKFNSIFGVE